MLTGRDLLSLVKETCIEDLEAHVGSLYELRAADLGSWMEALLGGSIGVLATAVVAMVQAAGEDALDVRKGLLSVLFLFMGIFVPIAYRTRKGLASLRPESTVAKDWVKIIEARYR